MKSFKVLTFIFFGTLLVSTLAVRQWDPAFLGGLGCGIPLGGVGCGIPLGGFASPFGFAATPVFATNFASDSYTNAAAAQFQNSNSLAFSQLSSPFGFGGFPVFGGGFPVFGGFGGGVCGIPGCAIPGCTLGGGFCGIPGCVGGSVCGSPGCGGVVPTALSTAPVTGAVADIPVAVADTPVDGVVADAPANTGAVATIAVETTDTTTSSTDATPAADVQIEVTTGPADQAVTTVDTTVSA